ncbi:hypothetical protein BCR34DRAFT_589752 [Clohesyomyces aquaticus]|uniref:Glucose-methanol-choline oxidoreductase N-terminal domain-containing protein n=1 Tax=Clohesyomyces aquaticus TaxID=1231657 RepID=A0A1Y1ZET8_9PLEO|nr:hypothetical protein BCR34DRAFT_589752 [Clohesyomyces aquaticus]
MMRRGNNERISKTQGILTIEAGGLVEDDLAVHIPFLAPSLAGSQVDWNYTTIPQIGLRNRTINIARGFVLGGSSCINQMTYHQPSNVSWDDLADLVDDPSLSREAVQKYWLRTSRPVDPVDGHDSTGQVVPSANGFGPVNVSLFSYTKPIRESIIETTRKEVILSVGFIGSPKILTLSGIGPERERERLGIPLMLESPDVGANLQDHVLLPLYFNLVNRTDTNDDLSRNATLRQESIDQWIANRTGSMVNGQSNTVAYLRVEDAHLSSTGVKEDPSNGAGSAHVEILARAGFSRQSTIPAPPTGQFLTLSAALVAPLSSGNITLTSADPFAYPLINANYLPHQFDQAAIVQAMKDILVFVQLSPLIALSPGPTVQSLMRRPMWSCWNMQRNMGQARIMEVVR